MIGPVSLGWLVEALIASSFLMVLVLLLRRPVRKAFGAEVAYALWLLPLLRLLLPPLPAQWHAAAVAPMLRATEQATLLFVEPIGAATTAAAAAAAATPSFPWLAPLLALLWIGGAAAFVAWHSLAHRRFCRRMLDNAESSEERDGVHVIETSVASGPLAFGIWRRYVAFPQDFAERYDAEERDLALAHELGHHARGDLIANWVALFVLALHWFNPVAWRAFRAFRADQEIANDARVLAGMNPMRRHTYACAILKAAHPTFLGGTVSATCHLHTIDDLKGRLKMLTTNKTSRTRLIGGGATVAALMLGGLGLTASGSQAAERMRSGVKQATGVDIAALVPPEPAVDAAQAAPAAPPQTDGADHAMPGAPVPPEPAELPGAAIGPAGGGTYTVTVTKDGKRTIQRGRYVKLNRDGSYTMMQSAPPVPKMEQMPTMDPMPADPMPAMASVGAVRARPPVPQVSSRACGSNGDAKQMVIRTARDGQRQIVVCTDRIAAASARGAEIAANSQTIERDAYLQALQGLRGERARMTGSDAMSGEQRRAALQGIDTAIAELEGDLAKVQ